jgi:hypothetical protein
VERDDVDAFMDIVRLRTWISRFGAGAGAGVGGGRGGGSRSGSLGLENGRNRVVSQGICPF